MPSSLNGEGLVSEVHLPTQPRLNNQPGHCTRTHGLPGKATGLTGSELRMFRAFLALQVPNEPGVLILFLKTKVSVCPPKPTNHPGSHLSPHYLFLFFLISSSSLPPLRRCIQRLREEMSIPTRGDLGPVSSGLCEIGGVGALQCHVSMPRLAELCTLLEGPEGELPWRP